MVRAQGIDGFKTFITVHPEFVTRCMHEIRVIDVNQQTLRMFGASGKEVLLNNIGWVFRGEMHESFAEQLQDSGMGRPSSSVRSSTTPCPATRYISTCSSPLTQQSTADQAMYAEKTATTR